MPADEVIGSRQFAGVVGYLVFSTACAIPFGFPATPAALRIALAVVLLVSFLVMTRLTVRRLDGLDELQKLITWRSMAVAGIVTVWFELFMATLFLAVGFPNLYAIAVIGPPEFWLCTALFARRAERFYNAHA